MRAVDSSVVIAAFAAWHEHHAVARKAMAARPRLVAHAAVEAYSVLTRLPPPHRAHPSIVHAFITERFTEPFLTLSETGYQELLATVAARQIPGGPVYDAEVLRVFRTGELRLIHAASCPFRYSSMTSCGVR